MTALDYAVKWINGELLAGAAVIALGLALVGCSGLFWKFGASSASRAMVVPLLVLGGVLVLLAGVTEFGAFKRLAAFREAFAVDPAAFVAQETARVQDFMSWYLYLSIGGSVLLVGGLGAFLLVASDTVRAVGLAVILLAVAQLGIDHFSKARAADYLEALDGFGDSPSGSSHGTGETPP